MKAFVAIFLSFVILMTLLTFLFILGLPLLQVLFLNARDVAKNIYNNYATDEFSRNITELGIKAIEESTNILSFFVQYSWVIIILIVVLVLFIFSRRTVEYGQIS